MAQNVTFWQFVDGKHGSSMFVKSFIVFHQLYFDHHFLMAAGPDLYLHLNTPTSATVKTINYTKSRTQKWILTPINHCSLYVPHIW